MYERFINTEHSLLLDFCQIEGCAPIEVKEDSRNVRAVRLRDKFTAYAYTRKYGFKELSKIIDRDRTNFYHSMEKETWKSDIRYYEQL